jgi:hypothetical protein
MPKLSTKVSKAHVKHISNTLQTNIKTTIPNVNIQLFNRYFSFGIFSPNYFETLKFT